jgi:uncharacterized protein YkwD
MTTFSKTLLLIVIMVGGVLSWTAAVAQPKTEAAEQQLFQAINQQRAGQKLPPLKWDDGLAGAARQHAGIMAEHQTISHTFPGEPSLPSRATRAGVRFVWLSENVASGPTAENISEQWMQSPNHRANILDTDVDTIGIGTSERNGVVYAVADFSKAKH